MVSVCLLSWVPSQKALMARFPKPQEGLVRASVAVTGLRNWSFQLLSSLIWLHLLTQLNILRGEDVSL